MTTVVDIYIKLIIAVLGFVAPTVTLLFPVFFRGIAIMKDKLVMQEKQFETLTQTEFATIDQSFVNIENLGLGLETIKIKEKFKKRRLKQQQQATNNLRRSLHYFELKKQIKWIFIPLFLSLVYVMIYSIIKENIFNLFNIRGVLLIGEITILIHTILLILTAIWLLLQTKVPNFKEKLTEWEIWNKTNWLYVTIIFIVISVLTFYCVRYNWFDVDDKYIKYHVEVYILVISILLFVSTIRRLWGIVCTVIEAKPMLEEQGQSALPTEVPSKP